MREHEERLIIGAGAPDDSESIGLDTREGTHIPNERGRDLSPVVKAAQREQWSRLRPEAAIRAVSGRYNCMGMVFGVRRTRVDIAHLRLVLREDGYRQIEDSEAQVGDLVVYTDKAGHPSHVAMIVRIDLPGLSESGDRRIVVMSKWGKDPEFIHDALYVAVHLGTPSEYWTDRETNG